MIVYDGIVEELQSSGGVTVVFKEIVSRSDNYIYYSYSPKSKICTNPIVKDKRFLERYRDVVVDTKCDVFHSTYYRLPLNSNIPTVTTVHDFTYEKFSPWWKKSIHCWQKYKAIRRSERVICVSDNTAEDLMKYCPIPESRISVINNGVSKSYYPIKETITNRDKVLFVGSRKSYKNFKVAVDAVSLTNNLLLTIVGGGRLTPHEINYLNNKLPSRFEYLGYVSEQDLNVLFNKAYCLIYPSSYEGFGIPIVEAMQAGCPVVSSANSSIPEVAGKAGILVKEIKAHAFADALTSLGLYSTRHQQITLGLENSRRFSWDRCFQETNLVYNSL
ncbi:glycosyltransferase family 1 protein [Vibrio coralliilyticus]|uniref:glycosyltransferase family 4 protein n=1 Tax=Vibrio coralliilyticus TaxID=190893 RepID=UPI002FD4877A